MEALNIGGLKAKLPIIQGGMGICVSLSELASAVANEGGIGVISGVAIGMLEPDYKKNFKECNKIALRKEIRKARAKTDGVIGVNVMMALTDYEDLLNVAVEEKIDVVFVGAGLPLKMPFNLENTLTKFVPKVSSARAARVIFDYWLKKYNIKAVLPTPIGRYLSTVGAVNDALNLKGIGKESALKCVDKVEFLC